MRHEFTCRVYYEDTDLAGIVYYANYLKFIERARSTLVREAGIDQTDLKSNFGVVFAVRHVEATYLRPAVMDDVLTIATNLQQIGGAKLLFEQDVLRGQEMLFSSRITVICMNEAGRPVRFPAKIRAKLLG